MSGIICRCVFDVGVLAGHVVGSHWILLSPSQVSSQPVSCNAARASSYLTTRYWALAVPSFVIVSTLVGVVLYIGLNCMMVTSFSDPRTVQGGYIVQFIVCVSFMCVFW